MSHPGYDSCFGSVLDGKAFGSCDRAAANWRRMSCHSTGQADSEIGMAIVEGKERKHCTVEVFDIFGLEPCQQRFGIEPLSRGGTGQGARVGSRAGPCDICCGPRSRDAFLCACTGSWKRRWIKSGMIRLFLKQFALLVRLVW